MRKSISIMFIVSISVFILNACKIVTVVPIGEEAKYTGIEIFSADNEAQGQWNAVKESIKKEAKNISDIEIVNTVAVFGEGTIIEFNTDTPKNYLLIEMQGKQYKIQVGKVYSGTAIRDVQKVKKFEEFNNQTEWSQFAKSLNSFMHENVVVPLNITKNLVGKTAKFVGAAENQDNSILITPIELTIF